MADPFRPNSKSQLLREAQVGLSIVAILLVLLVYVAFYRITGRGRHLSDEVRDAPVAKLVWPNNLEPPRVNPQSEFTRTLHDRNEQNRVSPQKLIPQSDSVGGSQFAAQEFSATEGEDRLPKPQYQDENPARPWTRDPIVTNREPKKRNTSDESKSNHSKTSRSIPPRPVDVDQSKPKPSQFTNPLVNSKIPIPLVEPVYASSQIESELKLASLESTASQPDPLNQFRPTVAQKEFPTQPQELKHQRVVAPPGDEPNKSKSAFPIPPANKHIENSATRNALRLPAPNQIGLPGSKRFQGTEEAEIEPSVARNSFRVESLPLKPVTRQAGDFQVNVIPVEPQPVDELDKDQVKLIAPKPIVSPPVRDPFSSSFAKPLRPRPLPAAEEPPADKPVIAETFAKSNAAASYLVEEGDGYWSIAQGIYQDGRFFRALFKHNESTSPEFDLLPGSTISTPPVAELIRNWPEDCPVSESVADSRETSARPEFYVTRAGDTLFEIAGTHLDQASRYLELVQLNQESLGSAKSTTPLRAGIKLKLPLR